MAFSILMLLGGLWLIATGSPIFGGITIALALFNVYMELFE